MQKEQVLSISQRHGRVLSCGGWQYLCILFVLTGLYSVSGYSKEIDPYTVEVDVDDRSQAALNRVLPRALDAALVKLSGQAGVSAMGAFNAELKSWVDRYGYRSYKLAVDDFSAKNRLRAVISFRPDPVDHARASLGLPSWVGERPRIGLWVVVDYSGERVFLPEGAEFARFILNDNAAKRGVYLQMPVLTVDGEVIEEVPEIADIWGGFTEQLNPFAASLGVNTILLAAATNRMGSWQIRWNLQSKHGPASFTSAATSLDGALAQGLNLAIDQIAAAEVIAITDQGRWRESIDVMHLPDAAAYQQLMLSLKQQRLIEQVQVDFASNQQVRLVLITNTSPEIVWQELESDTGLRYLGSGVGGVAAVFEYQP